METVVVKPNSLASILVVNRELEEIEEAFRLQPKVNFIIDFDYYLELIEKELNYGAYLHFPMKVLKLHTASYKTNHVKASYRFLKRAFFKDLSMGIMKELFFAEKNRKQSSNFGHIIPNSYDISKDRLEEMYIKEVTAVSKNELQAIMVSKRYPIMCPTDEHNLLLYKYAQVLNYCADTGYTDWSFNNIK